MSKIIEIYPDAESVKLQVESRKVFGWKSEVSINDRGVYEVTFTRDDEKAENQKLKELEDDFTQCFAASEYIERYNRVYADKKKFKAFPTIVIVILVYCIIQLSVLCFVPAMLKVLYTVEPSIFYDLGLNVTVGEETVPLTADWKTEIDLEPTGLLPLLSIFGIKDKILTITVEVLINLLFGVGVAAGVGVVLIIFFMIRKTLVSKTFYKAEVEYLQNRKDLLNAKVDMIENRMKEIMSSVKKVKTKEKQEKNN